MLLAVTFLLSLAPAWANAAKPHTAHTAPMMKVQTAPIGTAKETAKPAESIQVAETRASGETAETTISSEEDLVFGSWGALNWSLDRSTGHLTISGWGRMDEFPESSTDAWKEYSLEITSATINEGVTTIGKDAFSDCPYLERVTIPDGVTEIGFCAFFYCTDLASVNIPDSVTAFDDFAFYNCTDLTSITIPNGVTTIGNSAFYYNTSLKSVTIPDSVTEIGFAAFAECYSLTSVTIPRNVTDIGHSAFSFCPNLWHVHALCDMPNMSDMVFYGCSPDLVICIPEDALGWENCSYYTEIWDCICITKCMSVTYICNSCGERYAYSDEYTHPWVVDADRSIEATCTEEGYTTYKCTACNTSYKEWIVATGHSYSSRTTAATCTEKGYTTYTCTTCEFSYTKSYMDVLGHDYVDTVIAPTCTEQGYTTHSCSRCGDSYTDSYLPVADHSRTYTDNGADHTASCSNCSYSVSAPHTYTDGVCICGAIDDPYLDKNLTLYDKSMDLQSYIGVNYMVRNADMSDYDSFYMGVKQDDGEEVLLEGTPVGSTFTYFSVQTAAPQMTENLAATIYGVKDGETYHSETVNWTVRDGIMEQMNALDVRSPEENRNRMTLMVDMLNYGAAAQLRFNNHTEDLANSKLTEEQLAYGTQTVPTLSASATEIENEAATVEYFYNNLSLQSSIELHIMVRLGGHAVEDLEARILCGTKEDTVPLKKYYAGYATIVYNGIAAKDLRETFEVTVYSKTTDKAVSNTMICSVEALAQGMLASQPDIIYAMMRYSDSAKRVFG